MTTNTPRPAEIAAALLTAAAKHGRPWQASEPMTVTEIYHMAADDPREPAQYTLAAGHDAQAVAALAASAPHYGRGLPDVVTIMMPGSTMANPHSTNPDTLTDPAAAEPVRGARVIAVTAYGIGGAMVAELANGPSPVAHGPHDPNDDDPLIELATAVWLGRQCRDDERRAILDAIEAAGLDPTTDDDPETWRAALAATEALRPPDPRPTWTANYRADMADTDDAGDK